ncbi:MAG: hypothetical protein ACXWW9_03135 [Actinomycetota bacterium]
MDDPDRPVARRWWSRGSRPRTPASDEASTEVQAPTGFDTPAAGGESPDDQLDDQTTIALVEVAHERDVSIARASEAEERERLARDRLASLAPLERRVEIAERRVRDAERRLDEISERVTAAPRAATEPATGATREPETEPTAHDGSDAPPSDPSDAASRQAADLRERLARTAARKRPPKGDR